MGHVRWNSTKARALIISADGAELTQPEIDFLESMNAREAVEKSKEERKTAAEKALKELSDHEQ